MPLDDLSKYEVGKMILDFHTSNVIPIHEQNAATTRRIEQKVDKLITTDEVRKGTLDDVEKKKNNKLNLIILALGLVIAYLTYLAVNQHDTHHALNNVSSDTSITAAN